MGEGKKTTYWLLSFVLSTFADLYWLLDPWPLISWRGGEGEGGEEGRERREGGEGGREGRRGGAEEEERKGGRGRGEGGR